MLIMTIDYACDMLIMTIDYVYDMLIMTIDYAWDSNHQYWIIQSCFMVWFKQTYLECEKNMIMFSRQKTWLIVKEKKEKKKMFIQIKNIWYYNFYILKL